MRKDTVPHFERGERLGAGKMNDLAQAAGILHEPQSAYQDETGVYHAPATSSGDGLIRFCSKDDHPGRGKDKLFDVYIGEWDPVEHEWTYPGCDTGETEKAQDWFHAVPAIEPTAGFCGFGYWVASVTYGRLLMVVVTDCDSPGLCCE